jgi:cyclophilin family peptidyl-prolyl cis-trans isomerase
MSRILTTLFIAGFFLAIFGTSEASASNPKVLLKTSKGDITLELFADKAPLTVKNFLDYVDAQFYDGLIFHRVIKGFMIQGGGMQPGMKEKATRAPIQNEAANGLKNLAGTLAMARTNEPHSASAQFFINTVDNSFLDHTDKSPRGWGYAVFGKVTKGMDVVKKIEAVETGLAAGHRDVPKKDVVIQKVERIKK